MPLRKSFKKPALSFGRIKKSEKGKSSASQPAVAAENIEESRNDVATEDAPTAVSNGSPKFLGRLKSLKMTKKWQKGASNKASSSKPIDDSMNEVDDNIEGVGGIDAVVDVLEPEDAVKQEDRAEMHDGTVTGDLETKPLVESRHSDMSALSAKKDEAAEEEAAEEKAAEEKAAEEEAAEEEMPSAPEDSPQEGDPVIKEEVHEAKEEARAESLDEVTAVESKKDAWMFSVESDVSEIEDMSIEAVQQEGRVALGYFETQPIEEEDTSLLAQIKQFPDFAAQMMEQHLSCLPKVQEWQANVQEWQSNVVPKMMGTSSDGPSAETNPEEDDRNDSYFCGPLHEDSTQEIRVM